MTQLTHAGKQLFDFQKTCIENVKQAIAQGDRRLALISLMGSGKTTMAAAIIQRYFREGKRVVFLVDLSVLIEQISEELAEWQIPHTILKGSHPFNPASQVIIASAQTVDARLKVNGNIAALLGNANLLLYDECHNLTYRQVAIKLYKHYTVERAGVLIGLSATPWRLNPKEYLGEFYDRSIVTLQPPDLIKLGRAVPCRIFGFEDYFDLDRIATDLDGDYNEGDMESQGIQTQNLEKVYAQWVKLTPNQTTIAFCATVNHAKAVAAYFAAQGVTSGCITGETPDDQRSDLFTALGDGSLTVLTSINTLSAGFNSPKVSCILYIRLTKSKSLYHQATGRGARVYDGKEFFYILDFGANYRRLGNPMSYQDYSILPRTSKGKDKVKICPSCGESISTFARICPICGYDFGSGEKDEFFDFEFEEAEEDLDSEMTEFFCKEDRRRLAWFRKTKREAYQADRHPDSAVNEFKATYGFIPPHDWHLHAVLGLHPADVIVQTYQAYLERFAPHDFWVRIQMRFELGEPVLGKKRKPKAKKEKPRKEASARFTTTVDAWWQVLGCQATDSPEQVKEHYRTQARRWHPDLCREERTSEGYLSAEARMKAINNAYDHYLRLA